MAHTLQLARHAFLASLSRDVVGAERVRLIAVLDALLAWTLARPTLLQFRADDSRGDVISFFRAGSKVVFWSVTPRRGDLPKLELLPRAARALTEDDRSTATRTINTYSRETLVDGDPLRIGFGALKNPTARAAVLALMDQLLVVT